MILSKEIEMRWNSYNIKYYTERGYDYTGKNNIFTVDISDLNKNTHYKVEVCCDVCGKLYNKEFKAYNSCVEKHGIYTCSKCRYESIKLTNLERHGVENVSTLEQVKEKISKHSKENADILLKKRTETNIKRYGVENPFQIEEVINSNVVKCKETKIKNGMIVPDELLSEYEIYKKKVRNLTKRYKNLLFEKWDGYDYYDNEYIKEHNYKYYERLYPTIDHKISIMYGFMNNISHEEIGGINNLCITKRWINSKKREMNEKEFVELLNKKE